MGATYRRLRRSTFALNRESETNARQTPDVTRPHRFASRRFRLLAGAVVLATALVACQSDPTADPATDPVAVSTTSAAAAGAMPTAGDPALGPDLTRVTGTIVDGSILGSIDGPVGLPLALDVASRGGGNGAVINRADVGGAMSSLVWDGGRPVTLSGDGRVTLPSGLFRIGTGIHLSLTDTSVTLPSGTYRLDGPHAVGDQSGLAAPSDGTSFTSSGDATLSGTGATEARLAPGTYLFLGPGRVELNGTVTVQTADAATPAQRVVQEEGSFEVTLIVAADGSIAAEILLGGAVTAG